MKNFYKIAGNIQVSDILLFLQQHQNLWNAIPLRTGYEGSSQKEVDDIVVRFNDLNKFKTLQQVKTVFNDKNVVWFPAALILQDIRKIALSIMSLVEGEELGRIVVTRLSPGREIYPHVDEGAYADYYDRFQLCLQGEKGCSFFAEDEVVDMLSGELWWFNRKAKHSVRNTSNVDRIHIILDIRTYKPEEIVEQGIPSDSGR